MVRTKTTVYAKPGTVSRGGLNYTPRKTTPYKAPMYKQIYVPKYQKPGALYQSGSEIKAIDIPFGAQVFHTVAGTPTIALLNGVQTGAAFYNRVGSRIEMKNLHLRGSIVNIATSDAQQTGRIIIVYDRQPQGALPTFSDIFQSRDQQGTASTTWASEINLDQRDRFVIIRDIQYFLPSVTNTVGVLTNGPNYPGKDQEMDVNIFVKLKGLITHFKSSTNPTVIGDVAAGALYLVNVISTNDATWQLGISSRLRFDDK